MPRQSGLEHYEQLLSEGTRLPVLFISGQADATTAVAAMKVRASEFLGKPFDHRTLLDHIERALASDAQLRWRTLFRWSEAARLMSIRVAWSPRLAPA